MNAEMPILAMLNMIEKKVQNISFELVALSVTESQNRRTNYSPLSSSFIPRILRVYKRFTYKEFAPVTFTLLGLKLRVRMSLSCTYRMRPNDWM